MQASFAGVIWKRLSGKGRAGVATLLVTMLLAFPAFAASEADVNARIDQVLGDHARYETTIKVFQQAVAGDDRADVAAFVRYPIVVEIGGRKVVIRSASAFIKRYDHVMTSDIVEAIKMQKYEDLFVNDQGVMFGNGEAWINGICLDRRCKRFVPKVITLQRATGK